MFKQEYCASVVLPLFAPLLLVIAHTSPRPTQTAAEWLQREKVRCLAYLHISEKTEEHVRRTREIGFNFALASPSLRGGDVPVADLMPLVNAADKYGLRIIWVNRMANQFSTPALRETLEGDTRRFMGADGRISPQSACPADPVYWEAVLFNRALPLAKLAAEGHPSSAGLLLDPEDYSGGFDQTRYCHSDHCFRAFLESIGRTDVTGVPPEQRHSWLVKNGLWARYCSYQDEAVVKLLADIRRRIDQVNPDFLFAFYPWYHVEPAMRGRLAPWDERLAGGLGTGRAPFLIFDEATYSWGYEPRIEAWTAALKAKGLHFLAVPGFNVLPAERVWWPEQMARNAYYAAVRSGGYWVFLGAQAMLGADREGLRKQFGGRPEEWVREFTRVNQLIVQAASGNPPREKLPPIPLPPTLDDPRAYQLSDLFVVKHSPESALFIRRWTEIGLPWEGGELVLVAQKAGEWFSFERDIRQADRYEISAWFTLGPDRGRVQLFVDDQPAGEPVDLYASTTMPAQHLVAGRVVLPSGRVRLELRAVGKNPRSNGYTVGLTAVGVEQIGWPPREWNVILPFDNTGENQPGYNAPYPPEQETRFDVTYTGKGGVPVRWQVVSTDDKGYLDFLPLVSDSRNNVAYALVYVYCPTAGLRSIPLGSDDGAKLWVNDEFVWGENTRRSAKRDDDEPMAFFRAGWNKILVKVTQTKDEWGLYFRIYDPENTLRYSLRPEEQ